MDTGNFWQSKYDNLVSSLPKTQEEALSQWLDGTPLVVEKFPHTQGCSVVIYGGDEEIIFEFDTKGNFVSLDAFEVGRFGWK